MSDFRTKLLGLTGLALTFAGLSYGAVTCGANTLAANNSGYLLRVEGETELVSPVTLTCAASALTTGVAVTVNASLPVTSKSIAPANTYGATGNSEVVLTVTDNNGADPAPLTVHYSGAVAGTLITFTNVTFPATFTATLSNIRVNASLSSVGSSVTESMIIGQNGLAEFTGGATVGQVLRGLQAPTLLPVGGPFPTLAPNTILVCQGDPISFFAPPTAFTLQVGEGFPGAFKYQADPTLPAPLLTNQENGDFLNPANGIGIASSSTQISVTFGNLPSTATVYVPLTISYTPAGGTLTTLTLATTQTPATSPSGLTLIPSVQALNGVIYTLGTTNAVVGQLPAPVGGVVTAVYTVTTTNALQSETFEMPVYLNIPAASATTPLAPQGPITVLESLAPSGALPFTGQASSTPLFATTTNPALFAQAVVPCQTTLLFPFVTNGGGASQFETGIAITNATTDNLGKSAVPGVASGTTSVNTPSPGSCVLNFYGGATQPPAFITSAGNTAVTAQSIGAYSSTVAGQAPVFAATLTNLTGGAANFTGYVIASCNFVDAHGFAFVTYDAAGTAGMAEGYLAVVMPNNNQPSISASSATGTEH